MDVAHDCPISTIAEVCEKHNATMRVIEAIGPGGGNPFLSFTFDNQSDMDNFKLDIDGKYSNDVSVFSIVYG